jgi:SAM-dependent methyltransferase
MSLNYSFVVDLAGRYVAPPGRLLDFGCGTAEVAARAREHGYDAYGVDTFMFVRAGQQVLAAAAAKIGDRAVAISPNEPMPFEDGFFDIVVSNQVFEHVPDLEKVCHEIARVTRPGGILLALMPTREVLWEDHVKMPLVHRFSAGSKRQRAWLKILRWAGFGTNRHVSNDEWINGASRNLQQDIFHRSVEEYVSVIGTKFRLLAEDEPAWARYRIKRHPLLERVSSAAERPALDGLLRQIVRRAAGAVLVFERVRE